MKTNQCLRLLGLVAVAAALPLLSGCVTREVVYRQAPAPAPDTVVVEDTAPPPPQVEVIPPAPGPLDVYIWAPGEWVWRGHWVWVGGHWGARPHPGAVWVHGSWGWHGHRRVWVGAHWY